jgi:hypothetical protein
MFKFFVLYTRRRKVVAASTDLSTWTEVFIKFPAYIKGIAEKKRFLAPFGDMTLWNILASYVVISYISPYPCVINLMLWGHVLSAAPETSSMEGGDRFHLDTSHDRPCPLVT